MARLCTVVNTETGKNFVFSRVNKVEDIISKNSAREIEDFLGKFYRGPGAKYSAAACEFFKQVPSQSPKAIAALASARRAYIAAQGVKVAMEARNAAMALDAAEVAATVDEILIIAGAILK